MISLEHLAALDYLQWLRTGRRAAELLCCNQSTVSRGAAKCQQVFDVSLAKRNSEWILRGDETLLTAERKVHQLFRWNQGLSLRIEAQHWLRGFYADLQLDGWLHGNLNYLEYERPEYLIRNRIIDAWLCSAPDAPRDSSLHCVQLSSMPTYLCVNHNHPLVRLGASVTLNDVRNYPIIPIPQKAFPVFSEKIRDLGLDCNSGAKKRSQNRNSEDLMIGIANPVTARLYGPGTVVLPLKPPIAVGDVLVVHADYADHPRFRLLLQDLQNHLRFMASELRDLEVLDGAIA